MSCYPKNLRGKKGLAGRIFPGDKGHGPGQDGRESGAVGDIVQGAEGVFDQVEGESDPAQSCGADAV